MYDEYIEAEFWDMMYEEFGTTDELDILSDKVVHIVYPRPGIILLFTNEVQEYGEE